jgi:hypothetical protein
MQLMLLLLGTISAPIGHATFALFLSLQSLILAWLHHVGGCPVREQTSLAGVVVGYVIAMGPTIVAIVELACVTTLSSLAWFLVDIL